MKHPQEEAFALSNWERSKAASSRDVERARAAIKTILAIPTKDMTLTEVQLRQRYLQVLRLRVQFPNAVLRHLAARANVNKDVYSARLKRAFAFADRMEKQYEQ